MIPTSLSEWAWLLFAVACGVAGILTDVQVP